MKDKMDIKRNMLQADSAMQKYFNENRFEIFSEVKNRRMRSVLIISLPMKQIQ
jgi:hypothetical protein